MDEKRIISTSKFLSLVLRHKPGEIGLTLGESGWVAVEDLPAGCARRGKGITRAELDAVVSTVGAPAAL